MGNAKLNTWAQWVILALLVVGVIAIFATVPQPATPVDYDKINALVQSSVVSSMAGLSMPTAAEVAALVPEVDVPAAEKLDNSKVSDIWQVMFNDCYTDLEDNAEDDVIDEVDSNIDDLEEYLEDTIVDFDKLKNLVIDNDETEVVIIEIGFCVVDGTDFGDDEDDKTAEVTLVYKFKYQDTADSTWYKETVSITGTIVYDEGNFSDSDIELEYSL